MKWKQSIRASIKLRCFIRCYSDGLQSTQGLTEELSRESIVVLVYSAGHAAWLKDDSRVAISVELPHSGLFVPRVLECAATVSSASLVKAGLRICARIDRMVVKDRISPAGASARAGTEPFARQQSCVSERAQDIHRVVQGNHLTNESFHNTKGEYKMSFLKNLFIEEDGQDMVEYGLVLAVVVLGAAVFLGAFKTSVSSAYTSLGTDVTTNVK